MGSIALAISKSALKWQVAEATVCTVALFLLVVQICLDPGAICLAKANCALC